MKDWVRIKWNGSDKVIDCPRYRAEGHEGREINEVHSKFGFDFTPEEREVIKNQSPTLKEQYDSVTSLLVCQLCGRSLLPGMIGVELDGFKAIHRSPSCVEINAGLFENERQWFDYEEKVLGLGDTGRIRDALNRDALMRRIYAIRGN